MLRIKDKIGITKLGYEFETRYYQYTEETRLFLTKGDEEIGEVFEENEIVFWRDEDENKLIREGLVERI